ncbi:MAG: hypothetical protein ACLFN2_05625 [Bacteroidales bacterium]
MASHYIDPKAVMDDLERCKGSFPGPQKEEGGQNKSSTYGY